MRSVYIVGKGGLIETMYRKRGWEISKSPAAASLIQFNGGEDVDPQLYGEEKHPRTQSNPQRDSVESHVFWQYTSTPKVGICRGAQLLGVLSGGKMWQHIDNHRFNGFHRVYDTQDEDKYYLCTSIHHQMMIPGEQAITLGVSKMTTKRETATAVDESKDFEDIEVLFYPNTNSLCYQPHPEFVSDNHECQDWYFELINRWFPE
jgi:gamma-glutamyl-gamma-aminobutyrate hydrolase PuuD